MNLVLAIVFIVLLSACAASTPPTVTPVAGPSTSTKDLPDNTMTHGIVQDAFGQWRIGTGVEGSTLLCVILVDGDKEDACISIQDLRNFVKDQTK